MNKNRTTIFAIITIVFLIYPLSVWGQIFSLSLDADTAPGDQSVLSLDVPADQIVPLQIFGRGLRGATGIAFRLEFDSQQVVYDRFQRGYLTSYSTVYRYINPLDYQEIELELADPIAVDSGVVSTVGFRTKANFSHTTIRLVWAEKLVGDHKERVPINVGIELLLGQPPSSDFNDDGRVDFPDFLLFVGKFGSKQGDETYQDRFDLDSDGAIGFSDFLIFSSAFGQESRSQAFDIELVFINENAFTLNEKNTISQAARLWESIITTDLPDVDYSIYPWDYWDSLLEERIYINDTVDDLRIFVGASSLIDAAGRGGPTAFRDGSLLPIVGSIILDKDKMEDEYSLFNVACHEIGHVLGIGTLWDWDHFNLLGDPSQNNPEADTYFRGPQAIAAFNAAGGTSYTAGRKVPVESGGDDAHWRESIFIDELMTPVYTVGYAEPLSAITVQSLADLGYSVDVTQADAYQLPSQATKRLVSSKHKYKDCIPIRPRYIVDERGRVVRIINDAN